MPRVTNRSGLQLNAEAAKAGRPVQGQRIWQTFGDSRQGWRGKPKLGKPHYYRSKWNRLDCSLCGTGDQSGLDVMDHVFPDPCPMLMKEFGTRIPKRGAATARPPPIAIRMQHDPRLVAKRARQMHHHGVDA